MSSVNNRRSLVVFFCLLGWVYADSALGQNGDAPAGDKPAQTQSIFDATSSADNASGEIPKSQSVSISSFGLIDLHVKDLELTQVLQLLSIQSQRNIVASRNVSGTVTADLYSVDFYEAMDALLHTNGFGYREKGNFIYVYTAEELKTMAEADRKLTHKIYRLNYITAADAEVFVRHLLSSVGSISVSINTTSGFEPSVSDGGANSFASVDTLIIRDYPENVDEVIKVLVELDVRPKQVLVEATVLQADLNEDNAFGVDMTIIGDFAFNQFTGGASSVISSMIAGTVSGNGQAFQTTVGDTASRSGVRAGIISDNIAAFVKALDEVTDTTILSHPKILVLNRQKGHIHIGRRLGYISTTQTESSSTQTVEFLNVGTTLAIRPFVSDDGFIRMEIQPKISDGSVTVTDNFTVPVEFTQELTTNIMVRNGQTVVLGGLFKEETTVTRKQVPGIGDVPLIGAAFKGQDDKVTRSEVIFLITPSVVRDEAIYAASDRMKDGVELAHLGARQGLLPWSRSKLTASHMRDAMKYYESGDKNKALWAANLALQLDPHLVEAQKLREAITGKREYWPSRDMAGEAINDMVQQIRSENTGAQAPAADLTPMAAVRPAAHEVGSQVSTYRGMDAQPANMPAAPGTDPMSAPQGSTEADPADSVSNVLGAIRKWVPESDTQPSELSVPVEVKDAP